MVDYLITLVSLRWWIIIPAMGVVGIKEGGLGEGVWGIILGFLAMAGYSLCSQIADFMYITSPFWKGLICAGIPAIGEIVCIIYIADGLSKKIADILYAVCGIIIIFVLLEMFNFGVIVAIIGCFIIYKVYRYFRPKRIIPMPKLSKIKKIKL